jgi:5-methylcytosine-specific restriction endonuclease McrA
VAILRCCSYPGCGRIVHNPPGSNRCPNHPQRKKRSGTYSRDAAKVRAAATICYLCGLPFNDPNDPPVADHVVPRVYGGSDHIGNLAAAHRSCNGRKGAGIAAWTPAAQTTRYSRKW